MKTIKNILFATIIIGLIVPKDVFFFVAHIPTLVEHFHHHNREHKQIGLPDFIAEHLSENNHHNSHPDHDNLPFCHEHSADCNQSFTGIPVFCKEDFNIPASSTKKITSNQFFRHSEFVQSIWQPPKIS